MDGSASALREARLVKANIDDLSKLLLDNTFFTLFSDKSIMKWTRKYGLH